MSIRLSICSFCDELAGDCVCPTLGDKPDNILKIADRLTSGARNKDYGSPALEFARVGLMWEAILGVPVTPMQVSMCMVALKVCRQVHKSKRDNLVDIAGYARTAEMLGDAD